MEIDDKWKPQCCRDDEEGKCYGEEHIIRITFGEFEGGFSSVVYDACKACPCYKRGFRRRDSECEINTDDAAMNLLYAMENPTAPHKKLSDFDEEIKRGKELAARLYNKPKLAQLFDK